MALWALPGFVAARMAKRRARLFGNAGYGAAAAASAAAAMKGAQSGQGAPDRPDVQDVPWRDVPGSGR